MRYSLEFSSEAKRTLESLATDSKKLKKVKKTLGLLEVNIKHPSLQTHKYESLSGPHGEAVFEAYVENNTPSAYRIFWYYGPEQRVITILSITPHP